MVLVLLLPLRLKVDLVMDRRVETAFFPLFTFSLLVKPLSLLATLQDLDDGVWCGVE